MGQKISKIKKFSFVELLKSPKEHEQLKPFLPEDTDEVDRYHSHHFLKRYIFNSSFSAPIEKELRRNDWKVLDVACGPGTWLLDLAINYPRSSFWGLDIKEFFPSEIKPDNLKFIQHDLLKGLPYPDDEFDFVHQETMLLMLTPNQWEYAISEIIRVTKPGGWIEIVEPYTFTTGAGPLFTRFYTSLSKSFLSRGIDIEIVQNIREMLESMPNLTNINSEKRNFILGPNGDKFGESYLDSIFRNSTSSDVVNLEGISNQMGITKEEYLRFLPDLMDEVCSTSIEHFLCRVYAQKVKNIDHVEKVDEEEIKIADD